MSTAPITSTEKKRRFFLFAGGAFLVVICIVLASFYLFAPSKPPSTTNLAVAKRDNVKGQAGGQGSEEYNKKLEEHDAEKANAALTAGESFIPTPVGKPSLITKKADTPPPPPPTVATPRVAPARTPRVDNTLLKRMMEDLAQLDAKLSNASVGQAQIVYLCDFEKEKKKATASRNMEGSSAATAEAPQLDLKPGDLLYAVIDTGVNSDVPSAVMATIVQGKYKKSRLLGKFQRFEERLVLAFTRIIPPSGGDLQIEAYAVDPGTTEASVASSVDTHFFSRWGGLIASAFLEGLGDAKKYNGAQSTVYGGYNGYNGTDQMIWNEYSWEDQAWIAAGKVGEKAGKIFEKNFDRPPTVYLKTGSPIGVLVLNVKPKQR